LRRWLLPAALLCCATQAQAACPEPAALRQGFDAVALCRAVGQGSFPYHGVLIERHGELVTEVYRAGADRSIYSPFARNVDFGPQTLHDLRSISKSVTSLLWGIAQGEGSVPSPQTAVTAVLPALADPRRPELNAITIADLLDMSTGLAWNESGVYDRFNDETGLYWRADRAGHVFSRATMAPPGRRFNYNGGNTAILAHILEQRTGMPLEAYARRRLFEPLGITHWEWQRDLRGRALAYSGLRLTPRDLLKLGRLMLQQGRWQGRQVVPAAWIAQSLQPRIATTDGLRYGHQWWMGTTQALGRPHAWLAGFGNGGQRLFIVPSLDLAMVVTAGEYDRPAAGPQVNRLLDSVTATLR